MHDPVLRVLTVLEILQARDRMTGAELAARLEVDLRTVQRYIARLKDLGFPIDASPGVGGSYRLLPGHRLPPLLLTHEEAFALSLGLRTLRSVGLSAFAPATEGSLAKLSRLLPPPLRDSLETVDAAVSLEPGAWVMPTTMQSLHDVATAIRGSRRVRFTYRSHGGAVTARTIEPYAVLHADSRWYLIGVCLARAGLRTFRLDRVDALAVLEDVFERPPHFDARRYFAEHMPFAQSVHRIDVWIDMPAEEAARNFAPWRVAVEADGTGARLRCGRDTLELFAAMLLATGRRLVVHEPPALRTTFSALAASALLAAESKP